MTICSPQLFPLNSAFPKSILPSGVHNENIRQPMFWKNKCLINSNISFHGLFIKCILNAFIPHCVYTD